jgi:beta-N-acetylhexosaminidase
MAHAFICGCLGQTLAAEERAFLKDADPLGVILFKRNIGTSAEVAALTADIRAALGRDDALILVDQEGGRVQRLGPPHWRRYPAAARFAAIADAEERRAAIRLTARLMAEDLLRLGIDVDCLPVLDVPVAGAHDVIGDRAYARDPDEVAASGRAAAEGLLDGGVLPIMKHMPGHGRAGVDSHLALPIVAADLAELEAQDFRPFRANRDLPAGMTAHVVYRALDSERPATLSPRIVGDIIRGTIGFDGLLFSDDLSMKALPGGFGDKAEGLFAAGVDIALHCNGDLAEARDVAAAAPAIAGETRRRLDAALAARRRPGPAFDPVDALARLDAVLAPVA